MAQTDPMPDAGYTNVDQVEKNLYLGNVTTAMDLDWLKKHNISHILTIETCPLPQKIETFMPHITFQYFHLADMPRADILSLFQSSFEFLDKALESGGTVLVHCFYGVSRSATLVIAYLMKKYSMSFSDAYELVKQKRKIAYPNRGFQEQLKLYEEMGFAEDSTNMKFKIYRLQLAANNVRKVKILPREFYDLIKPDPALASVHPEPTVYR